MGTSVGRKHLGEGVPVHRANEKLSSDPDLKDLPVERKQIDTHVEGNDPDGGWEVFEL